MSRFSFGKVMVRSFRLAILGAVVLQFGACARPYRVDETVRDDGTVIHTLTGNQIKVEGGIKEGGGYDERRGTVEKQCFLDLRAYREPDGRTAFELVLTYVGVNALNIEPGRSLKLVADLNSFVLSAGGGATKTMDPTGKFVTESLAYPVSRDVLVQITEAQKTDVIVNGREGEVKGFLDETNLANLRRFVNEYVRVPGG